MQSEPVFRAWIDKAAGKRELSWTSPPDPAAPCSGPSSPSLSAEAHVAATDASLYLLTQLRRMWQQQSQAATLDFLAVNANRLPFGDDSVQAVTSFLGLYNVWDDPDRQKPPRFGLSYQEAYRILKDGGRVYDMAIFFAPESQTAGFLTEQGCVAATQESFESFLTGLGL